MNTMSEPTEKQTPRTDVAEQARRRFNAAWGRKEHVAWAPDGFDFARQLETELAAAEAQAAAVRAYIYGSTHKEGCAKFNLRPKACSCGYDAALSTNAGARPQITFPHNHRKTKPTVNETNHTYCHCPASLRSRFRPDCFRG